VPVEGRAGGREASSIAATRGPHASAQTPRPWRAVRAQPRIVGGPPSEDVLARDRLARGHRQLEVAARDEAPAFGVRACTASRSLRGMQSPSVKNSTPPWTRRSPLRMVHFRNPSCGCQTCRMSGRSHLTGAPARSPRAWAAEPSSARAPRSRGTLGLEAPEDLLQPLRLVIRGDDDRHQHVAFLLDWGRPGRVSARSELSRPPSDDSARRVAAWRRARPPPPPARDHFIVGVDLGGTNLVIGAMTRTAAASSPCTASPRAPTSAPTPLWRGSPSRSNV
jgi:hypothetical protein